jgi:POT family proton-dependent oligopeptide transporter
MIGGFLADRYLGTHRSLLVGAVVIALGHIVLGTTGFSTLETSDLGMSVFIGGLALIILGTGFFKPCVSVMVGQLYGPDDPRRDSGFTIFYMGINLGAFICAFICGTLGEKVGWHWGFGSAAVGMLAGLFVYLLGRPKYLAGIGEPPPGRANWAPFFFVVSVLLAGLVTAIYFLGLFAQLGTAVSDFMAEPMVGEGLLIGLIVVVLAAVIWFIGIQQPGDKGPTASILILMLFMAFFWLAYEQAGSSLNVFAEKSTDRNLFGWEVPATWFQSVNALLILAIAPLMAGLWSYLARRGLDPSQPVKIGIGLLLLGGGFLFMVAAGALNADGSKVAMFWLIATYALHTVGELCLSPTGLAFVTKTAPARYASLLMGIWFISNSSANLGGGIVASYAEQIEKGEIEVFPWFRLGGRADFFLIFVVSSFAAGVLVLLLTPLLKRMLRQ